MPIPRELRHLYRGPEWEQTRSRILCRARHQCEQCGKPDRILVRTRTGKGRMFWRPLKGYLLWRNETGWPLTIEEFRLAMDIPARTIRVVLAVAHRDHIPGHDADENLRAWCQWCHLDADQRFHALTRGLIYMTPFAFSSKIFAPMSFFACKV